MPRKMTRAPDPAPQSNEAAPPTAPASNVPPPADTAAACSSPSKIEMVRDLLSRERGATLADLSEATGWQPHTVRAALSGLRKKGHLIDKQQQSGAVNYRITAAR